MTPETCPLVSSDILSWFFEKTKKNNILEVESSEVLLKKYEDELEEKYKDKKYLISERFRIIKGGMKLQAVLIKKEIEIGKKKLGIKWEDVLEKLLVN